MKLDEFAFFNQQLAGMLEAGMPLEGALRRLGADIKRGSLKQEMEKLEADLQKGEPLSEAVQRRSFPPFYARLVQAGAQADNLPAVLRLLADYYERANQLWLRFKGLMVYPIIVLIAAFALALFLTLLFRHLIKEMQMVDAAGGAILIMWVPLLLIGLVMVTGAVAMGNARLRRWFSWKLPGFKEANLSRVADVMEIFLRSGVRLPAAVALLREAERGSPAESDFKLWQARLESGTGRFRQVAEESRVFPPLFVWLVSQGGEELAPGFRRAAQIYHNRAMHRTEMIMYGFLPISVLLLGLLILGQFLPLIETTISFINRIGMTGW